MKVNTLISTRTFLKRRKGRGVGSGIGKTCGRGHKGQSSRSGVSLSGFEGGQLSIINALPKRGFTNNRKKVCYVVNLYQIDNWAQKGLYLFDEVLTKATLCSLGALPSVNSMVKLLAFGSVPKKFAAEFDFVSSNASKFLLS